MGKINPAYKWELESYCVMQRGTVLCKTVTGDDAVLSHNVDRGFVLQRVSDGKIIFLNSNLSAWPSLTISDAEESKLKAADKPRMMAKLQGVSRWDDGQYRTRGEGERVINKNRKPLGGDTPVQTWGAPKVTGPIGGERRELPAGMLEEYRAYCERAQTEDAEYEFCGEAC